MHKKIVVSADTSIYLFKIRATQIDFKEKKGYKELICYWKTLERTFK